MRKFLSIIILLAIALFASTAFCAQKIIILNINGPIGPATQDYIERNIHAAESQHIAAIIIQLNTPGGLETSMRGINEAIIGSSVPIISYVYPSGARAASAGLFLMYASHIAAMAPGTNIGAASPVEIVPSEKPMATIGLDKLTTHEMKAMNDAAAYIRSLAELRHRNIMFGEKAVREAASLSATEALQQHVIDVIAKDYQDLQQQLNQRVVEVNNKPITLNTTDWKLEESPQDWRYQFLAFITDPNLAYILMLIAIYGIFFELYNPGLILPGVAGVISLLIVLYAFQLLPVNYTGLFLILIGIGFMILELYMTSFVIGVGGAIAFIIGSIMLFDVRDEYFQLSWSLIAFMSLLTFALIFVVMTLVFKAHKRKVVSGQEDMIGYPGQVIAVNGTTVTVRVAGEIWQAHSKHVLKPGDQIIVTEINGLKLNVKPLENGQTSLGD